MVRVFLALELTGEIRDRLKAAQDVLRNCQARLTMVAPENIHITVKFLGEVDEKDLPRIQEAVGRIRSEPFPVRIGEVTVNNPKRPFTVWCSIGDPAGKCAAIFRRVEDELAPLGFARETRRYTPHATLARVKVPHASLAGAIRSLAGKEYGDCVITGIRLKKSTLLPSGPVYEDLREVCW